MKAANSLKYFLSSIFIIQICFSISLSGQINGDYKLIANKYHGTLLLDGELDENFWLTADSIDFLTMVEPEVGKQASHKTIIKVLVDTENIIFGIKCFDDADSIVVYSKARDVKLNDEDNIKLVLDTYRDERNGYIFSVNAFGAKYDAIVANRGERENSNWDGVWDAKTSIKSSGWSVEIIIPVKTLSFKENLTEWGFNVERKIQRLLEKDRWAATKQDYNIKSLSKAGIITNIPRFNLGYGLLLKFSPIVGFYKNYNEKINYEYDFSGDLTKRITSDISATLSINTDFAETEVDARRTNLTRFSQFFPEKRTFFLEGADIYDFGLGLGRDVIPYFSRTIGLYDEEQVPILLGTKLNGKVGNTNFGGVFVKTKKVNSLVPETNMGVVRIKQNIFNQSNVGLIATLGDPTGLQNSWLLGSDFTYQTSSLAGDKNFLIGIWGLYNKRPDLKGDKKSFGIKVDYPNDLIDATISYKYIGNAFQPSLGFVPRTGVKLYRFGFDFMPRPNWKFIRQFFFESSSSLVTDMNNHWESYSIFTAPIHFLMESGDRFEFNIRPVGERLIEPFEIEDGVVLPIDEYNFMRYRIEFESASKRPVSGQGTWWFGTFYTGTLDQIEFELSLRFTSNIILGLNYEKNIVNLDQGSFNQELFGGRLQLNFSPNLQLSSFTQYDNESNLIGTNTRMRWTISPLIDLFAVYNHNINKVFNDRWQFESNQFIVKLSYGLWY